MRGIRRGTRCAWWFLAALALFSPATASDGWIAVDYSELADLRALTHSGDAVGALAAQLRAMEAQGRPEEARRAVAALLEPVLEPYAFVLADARDAADPPGRRPWVEIGWLWGEGEAQPAWAAILRDRRIVMESDGVGHVRCFVPIPAGANLSAGEDPGETARRAWRASLPVTAWPLAALSRRLATDTGAGVLEVEVYAYVHDLARLRFEVTASPLHLTVRGGKDLLPPDRGSLREFQVFLDTGWVLEGARLEPGGRLRLFGSPPREGRAPTVLGHPWSLADVAAAYRAVFHGGLAEPYMSLDRDGVPWSALVTYGGRFRDTSLGFVSLLSDIRFKTFSVGWDVFRSEDLRDELRAALPSFRTHAERMAADARARRAGSQQTRLWFYPDEVELVLSSEADVMALRRARMTAAAERVERGGGQAPEEPPWTRATVAFVNQRYDALAARFPELGELDHVARWLALFAWLHELGDQAPADLPALLDVELPARRTPRRLPQLLVLNVFPGDPSRSPVQIVDQSWIAEALHRLEDPRDAADLSAGTVLRRAAFWLDPAVPAEARMLRELASLELEKEAVAPWDLDRMAYAVERLMMHRRVLRAIPASSRESVEAARTQGARLFSLGMGGVDLGMKRSVRSASRVSRRLSLGAGPPASRTTAAEVDDVPPPGGTGGLRVQATSEVPEHGRAWCGQRAPRAGVPCTTEEHRLEWAPGGREGSRPGYLAVLGTMDPEPVVRGWREEAEQGRLRFLRTHGGRRLDFAFDRTGEGWVARRLPPPEAVVHALEVPDPPSGVVWMRVASTPGAAPGPSGSVTLEVAAGASRLRASVPRPVLWRLLLGRRADLEPGRSLPGLEAPPETGPETRAWMVLARPGEAMEPWRAEATWVPPEERAGRLAPALAGWWQGEDGAPPVVVGVDAERSLHRLAKAPAVDRRAVLILPPEAWPEPWSGLQARLRESWTGGPVLSALPSRKVPGLVVVAGAGAPRSFGRRLLRLASAPSMDGRYLVVVYLGDSMRPDLPARLLEQGRLAGVAWVQGFPLRWPAWEARLRDLAETWSEGRRKARPWELLRGLVWYF